MSGDVHEVQFTGRVAGWIALALSQNPSLPFSKADIEAKTPGSQQRRDLTLLDQQGKKALTGEVKMPWASDGQSPYNDAVVNDARKKAKKAGAPFFFTWNVNEFLLWETNPPEDQPAATCYRAWQIVNIHKPAQLEFDEIEFSIRGWLRAFLYTFRNFYTGTERIQPKPLNERFIETVESNLQTPILLIRDALATLEKDKAARKGLNDWMRSELGWTVTDDPESLGEQLLRAAKYACYVFVNKLVFYEALLKRFKGMSALHVPAHVATGEELRQFLNKHFADAIQSSGDYETVFGEDRLAYGDTVPFRSDLAVTHWCNVIEQLHRFNFSTLDYEAIGDLFEKLITPEERSKYGQYFTRVEVVDLINSFCIRQGDEKVMDPACGGGTFLVRAYGRKRELMPERSHSDRLADVFGVDIERFPVHLSTINLSVRELVEQDNYPQVVRSDFFDIQPGAVFTTLPRHVIAKGKSKLEHVKVSVPQLDAVVTNPPYIKQEEIATHAKARYQKLAHSLGVKLSGRSDLHLYFWPHAASFLKEDGYLGLITSSQWLDVEYGFRLQEWILCNFRILALFESSGEPWFEGARIATAVTILQMEPDAAKRMSNIVRFVQLRRPLQEAMAHGGTIVDCLRAADGFRDEIMALTENTLNERFRARLVSQGELWRQGVQLGKRAAAGAAVNGELHEDDTKPSKTGGYFGGKWGIYLRAPDLWFELMDEFSERLVPLSELALVKFGVKSGQDDFFLPIDCSKDCLDLELDSKEFKQRYGIARKLVEDGGVKLVRCGEGRGIVKPIEAKYLEPEAHSLMEINGFVAKPEDCSRMILLVPTQPQARIAKYAREYIEWGEQQGIQDSPTCASRVTEYQHWYDLTRHLRGDLFWPMGQQYKHAIPLNERNLVANHHLCDVHTGELDPKLLTGILNSSWVVLSKFQYGRPLGVEGFLKTQVADVNMMLVPDPRNATAAQRERVAAAFEKMKGRQAQQFLSERRMRRMAYTQAGKVAELNKLSDTCELDMKDRHELDDAVLEMMGVADAARRKELIGRLYESLREFFERTRQKEEQAIANKNRTRRHGQARPEDIAGQLYDEIRLEYPWALKRYQQDLLDPLTREVDTLEIPQGTTPRPAFAVLNGYRVEFIKGKRLARFIEQKYQAQAELLALLASQGATGLVWIPHYEADAVKLLEMYSEHVRAKQALLEQLVAERTDDDELQARILSELRVMVAID